MRKQIFTLLTIFILVLSGISVASSNIEKDKINQISETITLPLKTFELKDEYLSVKLEGINTYLIESGKPKLPVLTYTYTFPVGTKILDVECEPTEQISQEIILLIFFHQINHINKLRKTGVFTQVLNHFLLLGLIIILELGLIRK